jgi:NADH:ubiquinone oxidoreductase subunit 6 (subunit J)
MNHTATKAKATRKLKTCAIICLGLLVLLIIFQILSIYQTRRELVNPLIPDAVVRQINQQYVVHAVVSSIMLLFAVGIYLLKRYWWAILLVAFTLVGNQFLNW